MSFARKWPRAQMRAENYLLGYNRKNETEREREMLIMARRWHSRARVCVASAIFHFIRQTVTFHRGGSAFIRVLPGFVCARKTFSERRKTVAIAVSLAVLISAFRKARTLLFRL